MASRLTKLDPEPKNKSNARSECELPPLPAFIAICTFKLDRIERELMLLYIDFVQRVPGSFIVFVERAQGNRGQIEQWLASDCDPDMIHRFLFRPASSDTRELCTLIDGSDESLDSFGNYSGHNTASDAQHRIAHFGMNDPQGLMQSRVGAEVSVAAGLEQVCVGKTGQDTIDD